MLQRHVQAPSCAQGRHSSISGLLLPTSARQLKRVPAARSVSNGHSNKGDNSDAFRIRGPTPEQLERAWLEVGVEHSTGTFLDPYKAPEQQRSSKVFVFVRHGHSTWNEQSRIQGNTDKSELTALGRAQAVRARIALSDIQFDSCFSSPHTRARQTTEIVWQQWQHQDFVVAREPIYLPSLAEVDLGWFQGLKNEDIARDHPDLYRVWREEPERFCLDGRHPVLDAFRQSRRAWTDMLSFPGSTHLVVTHKSLLRSMLCTAMGLPPRQFRAIDLANGAVVMVRSNARGDLMLSALNLTSHLLNEDVRYTLPGSNNNDKLAAAAGLLPAPALVNGSNGSAATRSYNQS